MKKGAPWNQAYRKVACFIAATDVEALFPSLDAKTSAEICRKTIANSDIVVQNLDLEEALL